MAQAFRCALAPSEIEIAVTGAGRHLGRSSHQVGSIHSAHVQKTQGARHPDQWHPIRCNHVSLVVDLLQRRVSPTFDHTVNPGNTNIVGRPIMDPPSKSRQRVVHVNGADHHPENVYASIHHGHQTVSVGEVSHSWRLPTIPPPTEDRKRPSGQRKVFAACRQLMLRARTTGVSYDVHDKKSY